MSDPLSVVTSITGLICISTKIAQVAKQLYDSGKDAQKSMLRIKREMVNLHLILCHVQALVQPKARNRPSKSRLTMIPIHNLITILTGCVLEFHSLDEKLSKVAGLANPRPATGSNAQPMPASTSKLSFAGKIVAQVDWSVWTEGEIALMIENLELHKSSLSLILIVLTWYVDRFPNILYRTMSHWRLRVVALPMRLVAS